MILLVGVSWLFAPTKYHDRIHIEFTDANLPVVKVLIDGNPYLLEVDLGSIFCLSLDSRAIDEIPKQQIGNAQWINAKGEKYEQPKYKVNKVQIGKQTFKSTFAIEQSSEETTLLWSDSELCEKKVIPRGLIGQQLLTKKNMLLDHQQKLMILSNEPKSLKKEGYDLAEFLSVPLILTPKTVCLEIEIDQGRQHYAVDTGSTWTIRKAQLQTKTVNIMDRGYPLLKTETFRMNGHEFGPMDLHLIPIPDEMEGVDGVLGMDFIEKHVIYLDFTNQILYIRSYVQDKK